MEELALGRGRAGGRKDCTGAGSLKAEGGGRLGERKVQGGAGPPSPGESDMRGVSPLPSSISSPPGPHFIPAKAAPPLLQGVP